MVVTPGFALYERFFPYATWNVVSRMHTRLILGKSAYALRHTLFTIDLAHAEFLSSLPFVLNVDTSDLVHQDIFYQAQLHQVSCHHLHQVGCLSRTTLSIILLTNIFSYQIYIIYQVHQVKTNFIRWFAIKDNTCQQSHVFIFIQWVAIKDNTLHHIANIYRYFDSRCK